jgi:hypothetical protein
VLTAGILLLSGCRIHIVDPQTQSTVNSPEEARAFLVQQLEKKYGEPFVWVRDLYVSGPPVAPEYHGEYALSADQSKVFEATVTDTRLCADNYAKYIFKDRAVKYVTDVLDQKGYIEQYAVEFDSGLTRYRWTEEDSIEEFLHGEPFYAYSGVEAWLPPGRSSAEHAADIKDLIQSLNGQPCAVELAVYDGDKEVFFCYIRNKRLSTYSFEEFQDRMGDERYIEGLIDKHDAIAAKRKRTEGYLENAGRPDDGASGQGSND